VYVYSHTALVHFEYACDRACHFASPEESSAAVLFLLAFRIFVWKAYSDAEKSSGEREIVAIHRYWDDSKRKIKTIAREDLCTKLVSISLCYRLFILKVQMIELNRTEIKGLSS
jgi:hypothetical protein